MGGVGPNIFANAVQVGFVPDDVFIIIPVPDRKAGRFTHFVDAFGGNRI